MIRGLVWISMALTYFSSAGTSRSIASHELSVYGSVGGGQPRAIASEALATLKGKVVQQTGNFMPTRDAGGPSGITSPLSVPIYVMRGEVSSGTGSEIQIPDHNDSRILSQVVTIVNSDKNGNYTVALPAGKYTTFALINDRLYSNEFDGETHYSPVELKSGETVSNDIKDNRQAAF